MIKSKQMTQFISFPRFLFNYVGILYEKVLLEQRLLSLATLRSMMKPKFPNRQKLIIEIF